MAPDAGKLKLRVTWDGNTVRQVDTVATRPQAFRLLHGKAPESAVQLARLLFNVCGNAQGAAAAAAIAAAQDRLLAERAVLERGIAREAMQEHLWRLLLDWPRVLELPQAQADFVRWHGMLRGMAAGQGAMSTLRAEFEAGWLGLAAADWLALSSLEALQHWWRTTDSPAARLLAALERMDQASAPHCGVGLLPAWTAQQALQACGGDLDADFSAQPRHSGLPAETGALGYHATAPLLADTLQKHPSRVLARVLARVCAALHIAAGRDQGWLDYGRAADGGGLAVVRTARGLLLHRVRLVAGVVEDYVTVAPTEWNFHPRGALAAGLEGMRVDARDKLARLAGMHILSLDPCVDYAIEINGSVA